MTLEDFKIGCEQWTRDEILESLYKITKQNNKAIEYIKSGKVKVMEYIEDFNTPIHTNWKLIEILKGEE